MKHKFRALLVSVAMILSACGGGNQDDAGPTARPNDVVNNTPQALTQVATRSRVPGNRSGAVFQLMSRSYHHARDNINSLQVAIPNWYVGSGIEAGVGGPATIRATVEYPSGTVLGRFLFSEAETGHVQDMQTALSDELVLSSPIPNGATFYVRIYYTNTAGIPYVYTDSVGADQAGGDVANYGVSGVADLTGVGGLFTNQQMAVGFYPVAILAKTSVKAQAISGDSKAAGKGDNPSDGTGFGGGLERAIGPTKPFINIANAGASSNSFTSSTSNLRRQLLRYVDGVVFDAGINDVTGGTAAMTIFDNLVKARLSVPDKNFYACTQSPSATGTYGTIADQAVTANEYLRQGLNDLLMSPVQTIFTAVFDLASVNESATDPGKWLPNTTTDGVHPSQLGHQNIANSGVVVLH